MSVTDSVLTATIVHSSIVLACQSPVVSRNESASLMGFQSIEPEVFG
jgi:hypothetical protein